MSQSVILSKRDLSLLALLEMTPATAVQIRNASVTFGDEPFRDERRVRERMQALADAGFVKSWPAAVSGGGLMYYYKLTVAGFRALYPDTQDSPARPLVSEIAPSRFQHALATAAVIVHTLVAAQLTHDRVAKFHGDGKLTLEAGPYRQQPDCHFQFLSRDKTFNVLFEIDNATEPLDSPCEQSLRTKLLGYESYQDWVLRSWHASGRPGPRPAFRVVVLTKGQQRATHILWLARACARDPNRRLCYAATQETYLAEPLALTTPLLNDHYGAWKCLIDHYPTAPFLRAPIRLTPPIAPAGFV